MKKAKIVCITKLPKILLKQENSKIKEFEIQGAIILPFRPYQYLNLYTHFCFKKYLYKNVEYQISKHSNKIKIFDTQGKNVLIHLIKCGAICLNLQQVKSSSLYSAQQRQYLLKTTQMKEQQKPKIKNHIGKSLSFLGDFTKNTNRVGLSLQFLGEDIIVIKNKFYFLIKLKHIKQNFIAFPDDQFCDFLQKYQNIEVEIDNIGFNLVTNKYEVQCILPFETELDIVKSGWGVLSQEAETQFNQKQYSQISEASSEAKLKFKGIWKNTIDLFNIFFIKSNFIGTIQEIIEGNLFKIKNSQKNQILTVELSKINCPTYQELGAYQSREFARKQTIGKQFNVYVLKASGFNLMANIIRIEDHEHLDKLIIQHGLGSVKKQFRSKKDMEIIRLLQLQKKSIENKIGIHSNKFGIFRYEDLTILNNKQKIIRAREFQDKIFGNENAKQKKFIGSIQKFKQNDIFVVRIPTLKTIFNIKLQGIKSLITKLEIIQYKNLGQISKQYLYEQFFQRDAEITIKYYKDNYQAYVGKIIVNKKDIAETLLKEGLVYCDKEQQFTKKYQQIEKEAKAKVKGIWTPILSKLINDFQKNQIYLKGVISQIQSSGHFIYYQSLLGLKKLQNQINPHLTLQKCKNRKLKSNQAKIGNVYAGFFEGQLYRVRVLSNVKNDQLKCSVLYIDYGNQAELFKTQLYSIPQQVMIIEDIAVRSKLHLVKQLNQQNQMHPICLEQIRNRLIEREFFIEKIDHDSIILHQKQFFDIFDSINVQLIEQGLIKTDNTDLNKLDSKIKAELLQIQKSSKLKKMGIWEGEQSQQQLVDKQYIEYEDDY